MILIVEDEFMVALDMDEALKDDGFAETAVAGKVDAAMAVLDEHEVTFAFVDLNLGPETSEPVLERLRREDIPFVVCTAYTADQVPGFARGSRIIHKPVDSNLLADEVRGTLAAVER